jgi:hypothetical protein
VLLKAIVDHKSGGSAVKADDGYIVSAMTKFFKAGICLDNFISFTSQS